MFPKPISYLLAAFFLLSGCAPATTDLTVSETTTTFMNPKKPNTQVQDEKHGAETGLSIGALSGINGTLANGVATAYSFEDKGSIVGMQLNIAAATDGASYVAWLENPAKERVRIGTLENTMNDVRHSLRLDTDKDLSSYKNVVITLQQKSTDAVPGKVIATGLLKDTKR